MLVPTEAYGKPLQFQVTRKTLIALIATAGASVFLVIVGLIWLIVSLTSGRGEKPRIVVRDSVETQTQVATLREENRRLNEQLREHVRATRNRIKQVDRLMSRISDFTGLPLDVSTSPTAELTSGSAILHITEALGRGGPLSLSANALTETLIGRGPRGYAKIREVQVYQLDSLLVRLEKAAYHFAEQQKLLTTTPLICPVQGEFAFTDRFGERIHPLYQRKDFHKGLDIAAPYRTPIIAPADGVVTFAGYDKSMGRTLTVDHGVGLYARDGVPEEKKFRTRYFHCARVLVKNGAVVKRGDVVATVGSTGTSTGNHLHYEVQVDGNPVDPEYFILNAR